MWQAESNIIGRSTIPVQGRLDVLSRIGCCTYKWQPCQAGLSSISCALMSNLPVHTGQWIDWSRGLVLGNYRTFSVRETLYITGATAAFLAYVGGSVWSIYAFFRHQHLSRQKEPDFITLQQRLIYRNNSTATAAAVDAFWVYWTWKPWKIHVGRDG